MFTTTSSGTSPAPISSSTAAHRVHLALGVGRRTVDHVDHEVGQADRVEGRAERLHQLVGQLADEADGVGDQHRLAAGQGQLAGPGVEGDEQPVLGRHPGVGQPVEEGRLAGVGVADQGQLAMAAASTRPPLDLPGPLHLAQVVLQPVHAADQPPAVHLELGLTGPPGADATGLLAEPEASAPQAGQPVAQQGQLHLGLALGAPGVLGEDVEDHRGAVDGGAAEQLLEVALLGRAELLVEDHGVGVDRTDRLGQLVHLAPPDEGGRVGSVAPLDDPGDHVGPGRVDQQGQLVEVRPPPPRDRCPGSTTPTSTIRSRNARSMRVPGNDTRHASVPARRAHRSTTTSATRRTGPAEARPGLRPSCAEPHLERAARVVHPDVIADQAPAASRGGGGAAPGATGQGLADPPLPHPQGQLVGARAHGDELDVDPAGMAGLECGRRSSATSTLGRVVGPSSTRWGLPTSTSAGPGDRPTVGRCSSPRRTGPMSTLARRRPRPSPAW